MEKRKEYIAKILEYEQRMLEHSYYLIRMAPPFSLDIKVVLESFLIHVRNIYDFLCEDKTKQNDDLDFIDCDQLPMTITLPKKNSKAEINKFLAHITRKRLEQTPNWEVDKIFDVVSTQLREFLNQIK